jgi:hypothetical protein
LGDELFELRLNHHNKNWNEQKSEIKEKPSGGRDGEIEEKAYTR